MLLLLCLKQSPNTYFEPAYNTLQWFWFQICFLDMEVFAVMSLLIWEKPTKNTFILLWIKGEDTILF